MPQSCRVDRDCLSPGSSRAVMPHPKNHARQCSVSEGRASAAGVPGTVKKKTLPRPSVLSTQIRPPCASMIPRVMGNPNPAPETGAFARLPEALEDVRKALW